MAFKKLGKPIPGKPVAPFQSVVAGFSTPSQVTGVQKATVLAGQLNRQQLTMVEKQKAAAQALVERAHGITVSDKDSLQIAVLFVTQVKQVRTNWEGFTKPVVSFIDQALKNTRAHFKPVSQALDDAEAVVAEKINDYNNHLEVERLKEQERQRQLREVDIEKAKSQMLKSANKMEAKGNVGVADKLRDQAETLNVAPVAAAERETVAGAVVMKDLKFEVDDKKLIPSEYLVIDERAVLGDGRETMTRLRNELEAGRLPLADYEKQCREVITGIRFFYKVRTAITGSGL